MRTGKRAKAPKLQYYNPRMIREAEEFRGGEYGISKKYTQDSKRPTLHILSLRTGTIIVSKPYLLRLCLIINSALSYIYARIRT